MHQGIFIVVVYVLMALLCLLFVIILCYILYKNKIAASKSEWQQHVQAIINNALFSPEPGEAARSAAPLGLLKNMRFRNYLIEEIVQIKKNLAGDAGLALCELYETLELDKNSFTKLQSLRWHIKAKGIQELSIMEQRKYVKTIFRLTNNKNQLIRNEAQCALVNFYGFPGLRFLNVMTHSISQWQQIHLLDKMNGQIPEDMSVIKNWLRSPNESLVIFSLKLATHYNCFELQADVMQCVNMSYEVRNYVMEYMKKMPTAHAGDFLLSDYDNQDKDCKLLTLQTLKEVGNETHILRLINFLDGAEDEVVSQILETLLVLNPLGAFQSSIFSHNNQAATVVKLSNEHAA